MWPKNISNNRSIFTNVHQNWQTIKNKTNSADFKLHRVCKCKLLYDSEKSYDGKLVSKNETLNMTNLRKTKCTKTYSASSTSSCASNVRAGFSARFLKPWLIFEVLSCFVLKLFFFFIQGSHYFSKPVHNLGCPTPSGVHSHVMKSLEIPPKMTTLALQ